MVGNVATAGAQALGPDAALVPQVHLRWQENDEFENLRWRRGCPPQGLKNLGNTCYLNSVLQCLTYTPPLANYCLLSSHTNLCEPVTNFQCPFCHLEKRIVRSLTNELSVDAPVKISNRLRMFATQFRSGRQEDAHEFLRCAIEACNSSCVQLLKAQVPGKIVVKQRDGNGGKEEPHTVVKEIFGGVLQSQVKCLSCGAESNKRDEIMDLSLDLGRLSSLKEALCSFFQPEVLDADNKYLCSNCKNLSAARKQMSVFKAPNVLVIQFKRFENFLGGKIDRHIQFDERLGLAGHMCKASKDARPEYSLYGIIVHSGHTQDSGHYYAYVKDGGDKWYCCDDSSVTTTNIQTVLSEKAYVLFYVRRNAGMKKAVAVTCGAGLPSPSPLVQDICVAQSDNRVERGMSLSSVKPKMSVNNGGDSMDSSVRKPQVELSGSLCLESSGKALSPSVTESQARKGGASPEDIFENGDSQSILNGSMSTEKDGMDSSVVTNCIPQDLASRCISNGLLDLAAVATSPSVNTSSSSSTQSLISSNPASACSRSSSGENKITIDWIVKQKRSTHGTGCEALQPLTKRSRLDSNVQPQGTVSGMTGTVSTLTDVSKGSDAEDERPSTGLDGLKRRLEDEGRQNLIQSEWLEALRSNLRAAKKHRLAGQSCRTAEEKLRMRKQIVDDVQEKMIGTVPRALKERLVGDLQAFFRCQSG